MSRNEKNASLVVWHYDDNPYELEAVESTLVTESFGPGFRVRSFLEIEELVKAAEGDEQPDVLLLDIYDQASGKNRGLESLQFMRSRLSSAVIIMRSSLSDPGTIVEALRRGADDFVSKKTDRGELSLRIFNAVQLARIKRGQSIHQAKNDEARESDLYAGTTMQQIRMRVDKILASAIMSVHVYGEPGTGKEVVADIFRACLSSSVPFVRINCGAISASLLESELFGHVKGAFTGAQTDRKGVIEEANGGWLFMDEVATLPTSAQIALLRVLENREIKPVGGSKTKKVDVRIISATNERLESLVEKGVFRKDLWQRLVEATIELPPLRERKDEIRPLIQKFCRSMAGGPYEITEATIAVLSDLNWQDGNIRELRNCLRAMTEFSNDRSLTPLSIPARYWTDRSSKIVQPDGLAVGERSSQLRPHQLLIEWNPKQEGNFEAAVDEMMKQLILLLFKEHKRLSVRSLSKMTGIAKTTLAEKLRRLVEKKLISADELQSMVGLESTSRNPG